jgi:hypothetical protein
MNIETPVGPGRDHDPGFDFGQPPGGYGPPGGGPPGGGPPGGWGPPPGGAPPGGWGPPPGGAPPGGWGPPQGGAPPGGAPPGGWGPPGGRPPGGAPPGAPAGGPPPGWGAAYGQPGGGYGQPPAYAPGAPGGGAGRTFSPGDALTFAWERIKADPGTILGAIIVAFLLLVVVSFTISFAFNLIIAAASVATSAAVGAGRHRVPDASALPLAGLSVVAIVLHGVSVIVNFCVSAFFTAGIVKFGLKVAKGEPYAFGDVFAGGPYFLSVLVVHVITNIAAAIGFFLLIIPMILVLIVFSMAVPLAVDRNLGPIDALGQSWKITEGNRMNLFIFGLIGLGLGIAGFCACGVGLLLVFSIMSIAWLYIYLKLTGQPVAALPSPAAAPMAPPPGYGAAPPR